jgi:hypothetical protein
MFAAGQSAFVVLAVHCTAQGRVLCTAQFAAPL